MNPVDDRHFMRPLERALVRHVDAFTAAGMPRESAVAWVYLSAVVAWAEDYDLVDRWLRDGLAGMPGRFTTAPSVVVRLAQAMAGLTVYPATQWLMHPAYNPGLRMATPPEGAVGDLVAWWATDAPALAYDVDRGPASITGWIVGDLLQALSVERRKAYAFCQSPYWLADGIIDLTLVPAADEFRNEPLLRTIDPCCGTGHFLVRLVDYLWELYTTGSLSPRQMNGGAATTDWEPVDPATAVRRILAGVDGIELDPLTAAVARLRLTVAVGELLHRAGLLPALRLDTIPGWVRPRVAVADSLLLPGRITCGEYARLHPHLADLPGASFTYGPWTWDSEPSRTAPVPAPQRPVITLPTRGEQLDLLRIA